jgi:D-amino-acid dehydrogenase
MQRFFIKIYYQFVDLNVGGIIILIIYCIQYTIVKKFEKNMNKESITVIGSGIVGICCALKLQSQGLQVTIIDKNDPVSGCSSGNAGHFATEQIFPMASLSILKSLPSIILGPNGPLSIKQSYLPKAMPWMFRFLMAARKNQFKKGTKILCHLNKVAMQSYFPLIKMANAEHLIQQKGYLLAFEGNNGMKLAQKEFKKLSSYDIKQTIVQHSEIKELEPQLKNCQNAIYYPDIHYTTDPLKFSMALFENFIAQGGKFIKREILKINPITNNEVDLITIGNTIQANKVIVATGAYSHKLTKNLGYNIPLETERGYHLMLSNRDLLNRPVAFAQRKFIMTPMDNGTRLAGTVEFAGLKNKPNWKRADMLLNHAQYFLNPLKQVKAADGERWMGFRPSLPDSLPVIDQDITHKNIFYAFGHQHLGLTQAAVTADLISNLVHAEKPIFDLQPCSIQRFN